MKRFRNPLARLAPTALLGLAMLVPAVHAQQAPSQTHSLLRGSEIVGMGVYNPQGEKLGEIADLAVDPKASRVLYGALSHGAGLISTGKLFAVPWEALELQQDQGRFLAEASPAALEKAPGFDSKQWPETADSRWAAGGMASDPSAGAPEAVQEAEPQAPAPEVPRAGQEGTAPEPMPGEGSYPESQAEPQAQAGQDGLTQEPAAEESASTGQEGTASQPVSGSTEESASPSQEGTASQPVPGSAEGQAKVLKASVLIGTAVRDSAGEGLGKISELAIEPQTGRIAYAVISSGGFLGIGAKQVAVPLDAMRFTAADQEPTLNMKRKQIEDAPALEGKELPASVDVGWLSSAGT